MFGKWLSKLGHSKCRPKRREGRLLLDIGRVRPLRSRLLAILAIGGGVWAVASAQGQEHGGEVSHFLIAFAAILVAAKAGGEVFERLGQPSVLGELVVGIVLGNISLVGFGVLEAVRAAPFLAVAAEIGVIVLLFQVGLESNLDELIAVGPSAIGVAVIGVITPVVLGFAASSFFMPEDAEWYTHLFVGATLAATSVGITARVLKDIGKMGTPESRVILGAAIVDDILGLILLAFVLGLVRSADANEMAEFGLLPILFILAKAVGFLAGTFVVSRAVVGRIVALVPKARTKSVAVVLGVAYCFLLSALAELVGLASIVGAFAAGLVIEDSISRHFGPRTNRYRIDRFIEPIAAVFVPVFFVLMGLRVDLASFAFTEVLVFAGVLSLVAVASKQVCSLGVTKKGLNRWAVGVGMIPRGEVGLIFAGVGSTATVAGSAVFSPETFSSIVAMVLLTTLATPPLLKAAFSMRPDPETPEQPSLFSAVPDAVPESTESPRRTGTRDY